MVHNRWSAGCTFWNWIANGYSLARESDANIQGILELLSRVLSICDACKDIHWVLPPPYHCLQVSRIILWATMTFTGLIGTAVLFITCFQCSPVSYFWNRMLPGHLNGGTCLPNKTIANVSYLYAATSATCDIIFCVIAIALVCKLKMKRKAKVSLIPILCLGAVASIAAIVRIPYIKGVYAPDFTGKCSITFILAIPHHSLLSGWHGKLCHLGSHRTRTRHHIGEPHHTTPIVTSIQHLENNPRCLRPHAEHN
ncbi:hypothetical protein EJ05DRAFT_506596 [Pseudovirgaria hyperparasitica]|uniref:Rhodopsin domain-containing protein n=1 Tax=Pseudovirgaria hyperparasitica TaxID=470096 RepID=A0A6A6WL71_9PEZI|nr:uncharacterized protein EJ05DRAFT_506596 [Pseudovirgaria hyperparasitica]KAF2762937.1 hypothetical protein EJ05DRAFT_506596 [Pseudovirgaria hyperparasitica]